MARPNKYEVYMLKLINADRIEVGLKPLKMQGDLTASSDAHSEWMLARDAFSHTGAGGSSATQRMQAAGYDLKGSWATGENIAMQSERGNAVFWDDVRDLHASLMNSPGHRANILSGNFRDIGIGIEVGQFTSGGRSFESVVVTQNFGRTSAATVQNAKAEAFEFRDMGFDAGSSVSSALPRVESMAPAVADMAEIVMPPYGDWSLLV
jgi:serralysin